jgi:drug/metabolite transporter (DMT)-like permease
MWIVYAVGASMFWGLSYVFSAETYKHISVFTAVAISSFVTGTVALVAAFWMGTLGVDIKTLTAYSPASMYFLGAIVAGLLGEFLIAFAIAGKNATLAGMIEVSYPIFIALFSYIFFKEVISFQTYMGGLLIFLGIFVIYYTHA